MSIGFLVECVLSVGGSLAPQALRKSSRLRILWGRWAHIGKSATRQVPSLLRDCGTSSALLKRKRSGSACGAVLPGEVKSGGLDRRAAKTPCRHLTAFGDGSGALYHIARELLHGGGGCQFPLREVTGDLAAAHRRLRDCTTRSGSCSLVQVVHAGSLNRCEESVNASRGTLEVLRLGSRTKHITSA